MVEAIEKVGFKQTDVGPIPHDWDIAQLNNLTFKVIDNRGKTPPYKDNEAIELIETASISFVNQYPDYKKVTKFVSKYTFEKWFRGHPTKDDLLVSTVGEYSGASAIMNETRGTIAQNLIALRVKNASAKFVFYWTRSGIYKSQLDQVMMSHAQPSLRVPWLLRFLIPLPPTQAEQTAIATALNDADALITQLEKLIAKKRNIKQGAMQELLKPKEGWEVKKLGDCLRHNPDYGINAAAVLYNESLPVYLRITDVTEDGKYSKENVVSVDNISSSDYYLEKGDLVFARTGASVGKTYLYDTKDCRLVFAGFLIRIKTNPEMLIPEYFQFYTQTSLYWDWIRANSMRTGQPGINGNEYQELTITLPTIEEQTCIAQILSDRDAEIEALEKKMEKYKMIKQGMMQNLLTGKIRLV